MNINLQFQTFYVSKEETNCPLIVKAIEIGKEFEKSKFSLNLNNIIISLKYGKRVLINAYNTKISELQRKDFLEIVDYDPLKKVLLLIGSKTPNIDASVHWLIHHARAEINVVIQINDKNLSEKIENKMFTIEKKLPDGSLELTKEILKGLRKNKIISIKEKGMIFVGNDINATKNLVLKTFEGLK